jgi:polyhydroxyalkanoate synthase
MIVYAPINRYHIMDIRHRRSVVEHFVEAGYDVYLVDWGRQLENRPALADYLEYIHLCIGKIKELADVTQVNILGYSWGGVLSEIYASLDEGQENVKNLILETAHVDFDRDDSILASWFRRLPAVEMTKEYGGIDCRFFNLALIMRNPIIRLFDPEIFASKMEEPINPLFGQDALRIMIWLYNSPVVPPGVFEAFIKGLYQENQLVKGKIQVSLAGKNRKVDLSKISMPLLTIVGERDDICPPAAALPINEIASSSDKEVISCPLGHIELCTSSYAHDKVWPQVVEWLNLHEVPVGKSTGTRS